MPRVRIGVSACLLGRRVRFDGGHKRQGFLTGPLADCVDWAPVCPEVGIGMGIPRPPICLVGNPERPRAVGVEDPTPDVTEPLLSFARRRVAFLGEISGYILKRNSPSCGMERVKVHDPVGTAVEHTGIGIFARVLMAARPLLPVVEEARLNDPASQEDFLTRVLVYHRWQGLTAVGITAGRLIGFHADHGALVTAHSQAACERMGRLLATLPEADVDAVACRYASELMAALGRRADGKGHATGPRYATGDCGLDIGSADKAELIGAIAAYRRGELPPIVPITRLRHYLRGHPDSCLRNAGRF
ncbi:MAG: COG1683: Uncharacterized conserved protein / FIG143828: Hypothetical protein YbgA [Olavius algarvensis Gamma 1 endosymbiont]|nr:MAG: COG1683: Uncharacterized conserved protein / FIG143828: Hypothetical protein YbgA [Olavius algarvensis Gamma 1 endosymbiont]